MSLPPTVEELRARGFVIQLGGGVDYHRVTLQHPTLHYSLGKLFITDTAEDAFLQSAAGRELDEEDEPEEQDDEESEAKRSGSLLDVLLTSGKTYDALAIEPQTFVVQMKKEEARVTFRDWHGYRVIEADSYSKTAPKQCKAAAIALGLTPILEHKLIAKVRRVELVRARLELAGVTFDPKDCQIPIFWVEIASDGTPVQCAARLDQLIHASSPDDLVIRDLKETRTLRRKPWANTVYDLRYHLQAAVYRRAVLAVTGLPADFEWVLVRSGGPVPQVARRAPSHEWIEMGEAEWSFAVDQWAKCVRTGMWPGWELLGVETTFPEPYHLTRHEEWLQQQTDEEADNGNATAA
jgi:hypothetical protein